MELKKLNLVWFVLSLISNELVCGETETCTVSVFVAGFNLGGVKFQCKICKLVTFERNCMFLDKALLQISISVYTDFIN